MLDLFPISNTSFEYITYLVSSTQDRLKGTIRDKLHAMHVKELIKTNYSEW